MFNFISDLFKRRPTLLGFDLSIWTFLGTKRIRYIYRVEDKRPDDECELFFFYNNKTKERKIVHVPHNPDLREYFNTHPWMQIEKEKWVSEVTPVWEYISDPTEAVKKMVDEAHSGDYEYNKIDRVWVRTIDVKDESVNERTSKRIRAKSPRKSKARLSDNGRPSIKRNRKAG